MLSHRTQLENRKNAINVLQNCLYTKGKKLKDYGNKIGNVEILSKFNNVSSKVISNNRIKYKCYQL